MGAGLTAIRGIRRLRPGEALVVDPSGLRLCQFDALAPRTRPRGSKNGPVLVDALSAAVANAVGRGGAVLSLSGGLDSAALAAVDQLRGGTLDAISFAAPGLASSAEVSAVDNMVRAWPSFRVARVDVGESMELPDLGGALRDDPSLIPLALLPSRLKLWAKARAEGFHAIIEGEGGDELFGLLPTPLDALSRARPLAAASQLLRSGGRRELLEFGVILPMLPAGARRALHALRRPVEACLPAFVARAAASQPRVVEAVDEYLAALAHRPFAIRLRDWMSAPMIVGAGLSRRHLANAYGLTLEWPMLERNFIEVVLGLHEEGKLRGGANKPTLQEALEGLVPNAVRRRPKDVSLYLTLIPRILTSHRARTALRNEAVRRRLADLVRFERIEAMLDGLAAGRKLGGDALWQLECVVSFAEWYARASREHGVD
jgi:asparagine synthetase B (glutamine-hydrolysing)